MALAAISTTVLALDYKKYQAHQKAPPAFTAQLSDESNGVSYWSSHDELREKYALPKKGFQKHVAVLRAAKGEPEHALTTATLDYRVLFVTPIDYQSHFPGRDHFVEAGATVPVGLVHEAMLCGRAQVYEDSNREAAGFILRTPEDPLFKSIMDSWPAALQDVYLRAVTGDKEAMRQLLNARKLG